MRLHLLLLLRGTTSSDRQYSLATLLRTFGSFSPHFSDFFTIISRLQAAQYLPSSARDGNPKDLCYHLLFSFVKQAI
jgi:hypothetical protein